MFVLATWTGFRIGKPVHTRDNLVFDLDVPTVARTLLNEADPKFKSRDVLTEIVVEAHRAGIEAVPIVDLVTVCAHKDVAAKVPENYPADEGKLMIKNDFYWAAEHREAILKEWQKRYGTKDAPKS